jgi:hypothetical protein
MLRGLGSLFSACALVLAAGNASANTDFGAPLALASRAAGEGVSDHHPDLATDGNGVWISVWVTSDPAFGLTLNERSVAFSRSLDDGRTWSAAQIVRGEFASTTPNSPKASIATDGNGKWIVAHASPTWEPNAGSIRLSTSTDDGATWSAPVTIHSTASWNGDPRIASDGADTWLVVWESNDATLSGDEDWVGVLGSRSTDGADSWSSAAIVGETPDCFSCYPAGGVSPRLATDRSGTWIVIFESETAVNSIGPARIARSTDNGATFSQVTLGSSYPYNDHSPDIATDGDGTWIATYVRADDDSSVMRVHRSDDDGATWSLIPIDGVVTPVHPRIASRGSGEWQIAGSSEDSLEATIGGDQDVLSVSSRDDGITWSTTAALVSRAGSDKTTVDYDPAIVVSPTNRTTIVAWAFWGGETRGILAASARQDCPPLAREDCRVAVRSEGSRLSIVDSGIHMDRIDWTLKYAQETTDADLFDAMADNDYVACLYEESGGAPGLIGEWDAPSGTTCRNKPCWKHSDGKLLYSDKAHEHGSIRRMKMRANAEGKASVRTWMAGPAVAPPRLPLEVSTPVRIQVTNLATGACWDGTHDQADENDEVRFESRSP